MRFGYDIPDSFWSLFRSVNRDHYIEALLKISEEYEYMRTSASGSSGKSLNQNWMYWRLPQTGY